MVVINEQDIVVFKLWIEHSILSVEIKQRLSQALTTVKKPLFAQALLLLLVGADLRYIRKSTMMPETYFERFMFTWYDLHGKYPELIFKFASFREDAEIMSQVLYSATTHNKADFIKDFNRILESYNLLIKLNGRLVPEKSQTKPPVKPTTTPDTLPAPIENSDKPSQLLEKIASLEKLDQASMDFLSQFESADKAKFLEAIMKDPSGFMKDFFTDKK